MSLPLTKGFVFLRKYGTLFHPTEGEGRALKRRDRPRHSQRLSRVSYGAMFEVECRSSDGKQAVQRLYELVVQDREVGPHVNLYKCKAEGAFGPN